MCSRRRGSYQHANLGQGAGIAIEDAVVLSEELCSGDSIENQLKRYIDRRYDRCKFIAESSELIGRFQMDEVEGVDEKSMVEEMFRVTAADLMLHHGKQYGRRMPGNMKSTDKLPIRRIVTGHDPEGKAVAAMQGEPPQILSFPSCRNLLFRDLEDGGHTRAGR